MIGAARSTRPTTTPSPKPGVEYTTRSDPGSHFTVRNMGVKQAPFYVLIGAEMPAILIEIAFISNPDDAKLLGDDGFIDALAKQISDGISQYANANVASAQQEENAQ